MLLINRKKFWRWCLFLNYFFDFVFEDVYWMHDDNFLSWQNYIHGSSQGQFIAETYIVFFLSILTNIKGILGYWNTTFWLPFLIFFLKSACFYTNGVISCDFWLWGLGHLIPPQFILYRSVSFICVLELVWKCNGQSNLWWNLHSNHILYLCTLFLSLAHLLFNFLRSRDWREVIVSQLSFSGFGCRSIS